MVSVEYLFGRTLPVLEIWIKQKLGYLAFFRQIRPSVKCGKWAANIFGKLLAIACEFGIIKFKFSAIEPEQNLDSPESLASVLLLKQICLKYKGHKMMCEGRKQPFSNYFA